MESGESRRTADLRTWSDSLARDIEELRAEAQRCQAALSRAEEQQALVQRLLQLDEQRSDSALGVGANELGDLESLASSSRPEGNRSLEESVAEILTNADRPLHISDIRAQLVSNGVRIPGRGDDANIIVRLRKDPERFTRTARGTYALASWGLPSLGTTNRDRRKGGARP
jgi:hypothetical protein